MTRARIVPLVLGLALAVALAGCGGGDDEAAPGTSTTETTGAGVEPGGTLLASVGPGFEISLTTQDGSDVSTLAPGEYTIEVDDQSDIHDFHLSGPGVEESTDVSAVGKETWHVTLEAGTYSYVCDPHASTMSGEFEVSG